VLLFSDRGIAINISYLVSIMCLLGSIQPGVLTERKLCKEGRVVPSRIILRLATLLVAHAAANSQQRCGSPGYFWFQCESHGDYPDGLCRTLLDYALPMNMGACATKGCCYKLCQYARANGGSCITTYDELTDAHWSRVVTSDGKTAYCDPKGGGKGSGGGTKRRPGREHRHKRHLLQSGPPSSDAMLYFNYEYLIDPETLDLLVLQFDSVRDAAGNTANVNFLEISHLISKVLSEPAGHTEGQKILGMWLGLAYYW
jgi:hypothetical protein